MHVRVRGLDRRRDSGFFCLCMLKSLGDLVVQYINFCRLYRPEYNSSNVNRILIRVLLLPFNAMKFLALLVQQILRGSVLCKAKPILHTSSLRQPYYKGGVRLVLKPGQSYDNTYQFGPDENIQQLNIIVWPPLMAMFVRPKPPFVPGQYHYPDTSQEPLQVDRCTSCCSCYGSRHLHDD